VAALAAGDFEAAMPEEHRISGIAATLRATPSSSPGRSALSAATDSPPAGLPGHALISRDH
jgi:hypothetical protein